MHTTKHTLTCQMPGMDAAIDAEQQNRSLHTHHTVRVSGPTSLTNCALKIQQRNNNNTLDTVRLANISTIDFSRSKEHLQYFDKFMSNP